MSITHVLGIDPGLVDTGALSLQFDSAAFEITVQAVAFNKASASEIGTWALGAEPRYDDAFIEGYNPRSHYQQDKRMVELVSEIRKAVPRSTVLLNTGVKKIITRQLMELVGCWRFAITTNHQDLRSAARIALLGMAKDEDHNLILASVVSAHLNNNPWRVIVR